MVCSRSPVRVSNGVFRKNGYISSIMLLLLIVLVGSIGSATVLFGQAIRSNGWAKGLVEDAWAIRSALEYAKWRLHEEPMFPSIPEPRFQETLPEAQGFMEGVIINVELLSKIHRSAVSVPDLPVPIGLKAAVSIWQGDKWGPVGSDGLEPVLSVEPWCFEVHPPGVITAVREGQCSIGAGMYKGSNLEIYPEEVEEAFLEAGSLDTDCPLLRLSPRVYRVAVGVQQPFTAIVYSPWGSSQGVPPETRYEMVSGEGSLEYQDWGVLFSSTVPGRVTLRAKTQVENEEISDEVTFDVEPPVRLCRVDISVRGEPGLTRFLLGENGKVKVLQAIP